ncbi:hypothetical protein J4210_06020 [Candidatus Woesearchaeota archaeon]|nr:hypothetical protein [Candidatus Woesearchaeota archaeon]
MVQEQNVGEIFINNWVSIDTMNTQVNVRLSDGLLEQSEEYAKKHGFGTVQELIKEVLREKVVEKTLITKKELLLVKKLAELTQEGNLFGTEDELFKKIRK